MKGWQNGRYEELNPTTVIGDLSLDEPVFYLGDRIYDHRRENGGGVLTFDWNTSVTGALM